MIATPLKHRKRMAGFVMAAMVIALGGCQFSPDVLSAHSYSDGEEEVVQVTLHSSDAKSIKRRQLYFSLVIVSCAGKEDRFPAEATVGGQPADEFRFPTDGDTVQVVGRVPAKIFAKYSQPCVLLDGGGYFTGTIRSKLTPIVRESGYGDSIKPNPLRKSP